MNILIVGCGGLGCELTKILVRDPSNTFTLIDDDTIDSTNLNRQFLFTREDVGKSKAETVHRKMEALTGRKIGIFYNCRIDSFKTLEFYRQFDVVFNCLDNDEARSHVNQRCQATGVKMIDGGSAGWLGQSFYSGKECFDCLPKRQEKVYPVCTIRQKPRNFEHCLVWARSIVESKDEAGLEEELKEGRSSIDTTNQNNILDVTSDTEDNYGSLSNNNDHKDDLSSDSSDVIMDDAPNNKRTCPEEMDPIKHKELLKRLQTDTNTISLIYEIAKVKARRFSISSMPFLDSQSFLQKIIPSVCTTNSIVASLMVLSFYNETNYYLVQGSLGIIKSELSEKNSECLTCTLPIYRAKFSDCDTVSDFLSKFKAESLVSESAIFDQSSNEPLKTFNGAFLVCIKKGTNNRIFFESGETMKIERLK